MFLYTLYLQDKHPKITAAGSHQDTFQNVFDHLDSVTSLEEIETWQCENSFLPRQHISCDVIAFYPSESIINMPV